MSDTIDENAGMTPAEDPVPATPQDTLAPSEPVAFAPADEAPTDVLPPAQEPPIAQPMAEPVVAQSAAGEAPTLVQSPAGPPPPQSWIRRRWVPIVGAVAVAVLLLFGGVAMGAAIGGNDDRDSQGVAGDSGQFRQDGVGRGGAMDGRGQMDGRGSQMAPRGGVNPGCDEGECPQPGAPQTPATPQAAPSASPQSL